MIQEVIELQPTELTEVCNQPIEDSGKQQGGGGTRTSSLVRKRKNVKVPAIIHVANETVQNHGVKDVQPGIKFQTSNAKF